MTHDLTAAFRAFVSKHPSKAAAARVLGISPGHLQDLWHGRRAVNPRIAGILGYRIETTVRKAKK